MKTKLSTLILGICLASAGHAAESARTWSFDSWAEWQAGGAQQKNAVFSIDTANKAEGRGSMRIRVVYSSAENAFVDLYNDSLGGGVKFAGGDLQMRFYSSDPQGKLLIRLSDAAGNIRESLVMPDEAGQWRRVVLKSSDFGDLNGFGSVTVIQLRFLGDDLGGFPAEVTYGIDELILSPAR